jgi:hypothetical protein
MPCDGPNKYMFCKLEAALSKNLAPISSIDDLITAVRNIVSALKGPDKTFNIVATVGRIVQMNSILFIYLVY